MGVSQPAEQVVCAGLEQIRHAERLRISRALHDQIGPSLCSAGLMIGLLRSSADEYPPDARGLMESIQDALESAIDSVRALSYSADPALTKRCGLRGALEFLARVHKAKLALEAGLPGWPAKQAEAACRILQDALLMAPAGGAGPCIEGGAGHLSLSAAGGLNSDVRAALALAASDAGLRLEWLGEDAAAGFALQAEEVS